MAEIFVTEAAQADLDAIDQYSLLQFGRPVADRYHRDFLAAFVLIADNPKIAPVFRKRPVVRTWPSGKHRIYFTINRQIVSVIRVLHMAMDQHRAMTGALGKR